MPCHTPPYNVFFLLFLFFFLSLSPSISLSLFLTISHYLSRTPGFCQRCWCWQGGMVVWPGFCYYITYAHSFFLCFNRFCISKMGVLTGKDFSARLAFNFIGLKICCRVWQMSIRYHLHFERTLFYLMIFFFLLLHIFHYIHIANRKSFTK